LFRHRLLHFVRQFRKDWEIYSLKLLTLSVAFACVLIAIAFAASELTVNGYHNNAAKSGRILLRNEAPDYYKNRTSDRISANTVSAIAGMGTEKLVLSLVKPMEQVSVIAAGKLFNGETVHAVDPGFPITLALTSARESRAGNSGVIISASAARKFFGEANSIGQPISFFTLYDTLRLKVDAVFRDPVNTHESFHILIPLSKSNLATLGFDTRNFACYYTTNGLSSVADIEQQINHQIAGKDTVFRLQGLNDIYFGPRVVGEQARHGDNYSTMILLCIAGLIFFLALTNYTNLTTLTLPKRSTELAVKKVAGARSEALLVHFVQESLIICVIALLAGTAILALAHSTLKSSFGINLSVWINNADYKSFLAVASMFALTALAPVYPAIRFVRATPIRLLSTDVITFPVFKKAITIIQLGVSISLIVAGLVVHRQVARSLVKEPGRNQDQVVYLPFPPELTKLEELKLSWRRYNPNIVEVTATSQLPNNIQSKDAAGKYYRMSADHDFLSFFDIAKTSGRWFGPNDTTSTIVNEMAHAEGRTGVGVIENFSSRFNQAERPIIISKEADYSFLFIRILEVNIRDTYAYLHRFFREYTGRDVRLAFMDKKFEAALNYEDTLNRLSALLSALAGIMACCSIYALSLNRVNDTLKQIAIRTTFGASRTDIIIILSRDFFNLLLASLFFFGPLTFLLLREWLRNFAYAARINWSDPLIALAICLVIVALTNGALIHRLSRQALRSALRG
jgi:putative ABC transport system permease protein